MADSNEPQDGKNDPEVRPLRSSVNLPIICSDLIPLSSSSAQEVVNEPSVVQEEAFGSGDAPAAATPLPDPSASLDAAKATIEVLKGKVLEVTAARDSLLESLGSVQSTMAALQARVTDLQDEATELRDFKAAVGDKLAAAESSESTISTLRSSLEDARRTLMRFQSDKETRTPSTTLLPAPEATTSARDKRMSLGVGAANRPERSHHRRISSVSDSGIALYGGGEISGAPLALAPPTVTKGGLRELRLSQVPTPPPAAAAPATGITSLFSGWGAGGSSATAEVKAAANRASLTANDQLQIDISQSSEDDVSPEEARRQALARLQGGTKARVSSAETVPIVDPEELTQLQLEVQALRKELVAAKLAREASETACRALREFVAVPQAEREKELQGMSLPPLPSDMQGDSDDEQAAPEEPKPSVISSWFRRAPPTNTAGGSAASAPPPPPLSKDAASNASVSGSTTASNLDELVGPPPPLPPSKSFISSWTRGVSLADPPAPPLAPPTPSRSQSLVSETSASPPPPPVKPSRFNFFALNKGAPVAASLPAVIAGPSDARSATSSPAPTIDEEEPQQTPVASPDEHTTAEGSQFEGLELEASPTPGEPEADEAAQAAVDSAPTVASEGPEDDIAGGDAARPV